VAMSDQTKCGWDVDDFSICEHEILYNRLVHNWCIDVLSLRITVMEFICDGDYINAWG